MRVINNVCMCPHTSCQYYQYSLENGDTEKKEVPSSEEGVTSIVKPQSVSLNSPSTSPPSSPYASPPQSWSPDRVPPSLLTIDHSVTGTQAVVTGTTTSVVVSRSSPKLLSRNTCSSNCSQPSSPALVSNTYRNKATMTAKKNKYTNNHKVAGTSCSELNVTKSEVLTKSITTMPTQILAKDQLKEATLVQSPTKISSLSPTSPQLKPEILQGLNNLEIKSANKTNSYRGQRYKPAEEKDIKGGGVLSSETILPPSGPPFTIPPMNKGEVYDTAVSNGVKDSPLLPLNHSYGTCLIPASNANEFECRTGSPNLRAGTTKMIEPPHAGPIKPKEGNIDLKESKSLSASIIPPAKVSIITTSNNTNRPPILVPPPICKSVVDKVQSIVTSTHKQAARPISSIGNSFPPPKSLVTPHSAYGPYIPLPVMPGISIHHGSFSNPSMRGHLPNFIPHGHLKGGKNMPLPPPNMMAPKPRTNGGRSGSTSSSSSSSGMGRKKSLSRGMQNKSSRSSDSSPSSSQYSSPPQTPSPDHTKDKDTRKKPGKGNNPSEETWEQGKPPMEEGPAVPPPPPPMIMNPLRQRVVPYPHQMGFVGYPPQHHMFRYSPSLLMGPRPLTPNEKSSRETTPPTNPENGPPSSSPPVEAPPYNNYMFSPPFVATQFLHPNHGSTIPNGYTQQHSLPPNFMNSDMVYPNQQYLIQPSNCRGYPIMQAAPPPPYSSPYATPPPPNFLKNNPPTCYNCGRVGHRGSECKEASIDDLTKRTKVL